MRSQLPDHPEAAEACLRVRRALASRPTHQSARATRTCSSWGSRSAAVSSASPTELTTTSRCICRFMPTVRRAPGPALPLRHFKGHSSTSRVAPLSQFVRSESVEGDDYVMPGACFAGQPTVSFKPAEIGRGCRSHRQSGTTVQCSGLTCGNRPTRQREHRRVACSQSLAKHQHWRVGGWRLLLGDCDRAPDLLGARFRASTITS